MPSSKKSSTQKNVGKTTSKSRGKTASPKKRSAAAKRSTPSGKGKAGTKRSTAAGRSVSRGTNEQTKEYIDYSLRIEIILWIVLTFSILCFVSLLGFGGRLGEAVSGFISGMFGILAYLFPLVLFFLTAFLMANRKSHIAKVKAAGVVLLYADLCAMMQLALVGYRSTYTIEEYYESGMVYHTGGGILGGGLCHLFGGVIGTVGTWIVLIALLIISLILITQRSLVKDVSRHASAFGAKARESRRKQSLRREEQRLNRQSKRQERSAQRAAEDLQQGLREAYDADTLADFSLASGSARRTRTQSGMSMDTALTREDTGKPMSAAARHITLPGAESADSKEDLFDETEPAAMKRLREKLSPSVLKGGEKSAKKESSAGKEQEKRQKTDQLKTDDAAGLPDELFKNAWGQKHTEPLAETLIPEEEEGERGHIQNSEVSTDAAEVPAEKEKASGMRRQRLYENAETLQKDVDQVADQIAQASSEEKPLYSFPTTDLLSAPPKNRTGTTEDELRQTAERLQQVFRTFGVDVKITNVTCGPSVTRYELTPAMGVKVSKIVNLQDDIKLNLAAQDIRIEAPIPGKAAVGIEVPNKKSTGVMLREMLEAKEFKNHPSRLAYAVGKDIAGNIIVSDIAKMPHLLIAGATGSGKSVFINTLIMSILYKASPEEVKMILIDPKVVELSVYNGIPHLFIPVVTDPKKAAGALNWAVAEMMKRYQLFAESGVRDLKGYNKRIEAMEAAYEQDTMPASPKAADNDADSVSADSAQIKRPEKLPQIVIVVDELADLMMVASADVEDAICRLAQLARAAGIHLVIATQRPSVDVITGLIKANMPSRIAFSVSSGVDSRTVLDQVGAEKLLGNGDMLFAPQTYKQPLRVQGAYVSDAEVAQVTDFIRNQAGSASYNQEMAERIESVEKSVSSAAGGGSDVDELFAQAGQFLIEKDKASIGMLQRMFKIGFNRAARIMDQLSDAGVVGPEEGTKPRKIIMSAEQFENYLEQGGR